MYVPSHFDESRLAVLHEFIRQHPFAAIIANTAAGLEGNHLPLLVDAERGRFGTLRGHIARANPMWQTVSAGSEVLTIFQGVSHYVSPRWYPSKREHGKVVPTWNYAVIHARGSIQWFHDPDWLRSLLETTTNLHEGTHPMPWHVSDAPDEYVRRQIGAIVGFEILLSDLTGKWKLSQNRNDADRAGVTSALEGQPDEGAQEMAALMKKLDKSNGS